MAQLLKRLCVLLEVRGALVRAPVAADRAGGGGALGGSYVKCPSLRHFWVNSMSFVLHCALGWFGHFLYLAGCEPLSLGGWTCVLYVATSMLLLCEFITLI